VDELNRSQGALAYQEKYGQYDADFIGKNEKLIYLSFDQGYENGFTAPILDTLKEKNVPAVFFLTGHYAKTQPELIQRMIDEGHTLGNHSQNHPSFPDTPLQQCQQEVQEIHDYVKDNFNYEMSLFRFPAGEFSEQTLKLMQDMGYRSVFWSFAYRDGEVDNQPDPAGALETIVSKAHPGAIILLHSVSETNAEILGDVIDRLRAEGYEFAAYAENVVEES
jgi:peptidoglycan-N-acetylmuramic acid deacetylase